MRFTLFFALIPIGLGAQAPADSAHRFRLPNLPDSLHGGTHVLALAKAPDGALWVGTYGKGIYVLRPGAEQWEQIKTDRDTAKHAISFDFVNAFGVGAKGEIWYGTVGNGWGLSTDNGKTWTNWQLRQLGPEWQYVAPNGIVVRGDTVYVGTADGIKLTWDNGATWRVVTDSFGASTAKDTVWGRIANQYVEALAVDGRGNLWVSHVKGIERSKDGGRTWTSLGRPPADSAAANRARAFAVQDANRMLVGTEHGVFVYDSMGRIIRRPTDVLAYPAVQQILARGAASLIASDRGVSQLDRFPSSQSTDPRWRLSDAIAQLDSTRTVVGTMAGLYSGRAPGAPTVPPPFGPREGRGRGERGDTAQERGGRRGRGEAGDTVELPPDLARARDSVSRHVADSLRDMREDMQRQLQSLAQPENPKHLWFRRPISLDDQPYIDQTYRYGSTMGGYFQQHQGVEFNNGNGTPVHAIGGGTVVWAGPAENGALTVAIRHDSTIRQHDTTYHVYSVYYHNSALLVSVGQKVRAGDEISRVGNTGRATNDHLHLEVHAAAIDSVKYIVDPNERYPHFTTNPELWIDPLPGTGAIAGQVWDDKHHAVPQARIYGIAKAEPQETPFSFIETYGEHNRGTPRYDEHFALSDVTPGLYILSVEVNGKRLLRRVLVSAGKVTWVVFKP